MPFSTSRERLINKKYLRFYTNFESSTGGESVIFKNLPFNKGKRVFTFINDSPFLLNLKKGIPLQNSFIEFIFESQTGSSLSPLSYIHYEYTNNVKESDRIVELTDLSGNNNHATQASGSSKRPYFMDGIGIDFRGNEFLEIPSLPYSPELYVFAVIAPRDVTRGSTKAAEQMMLQWGDDGSSPRTMFTLRGDNNGVGFSIYSDGNNSASIAYDDININETVIVSSYMDPSDIYISSKARPFVSTGGSFSTEEIGRLGSATSNDSFASYTLKEMFVFTETPSGYTKDSLKDEVEIYFQDKWGL
jgi:hypothetical protein